MRKILILSFIALAVGSCKRREEKVPGNLISPDSMVSILVNIHLAEAAANITRINDVQSFKARELYPAIFKTHRTDSITFHSSFDYYLQRPKKLETIYDKVLNELSRRESEAGKLK